MGKSGTGNPRKIKHWWRQYPSPVGSKETMYGTFFF